MQLETHLEEDYPFIRHLRSFLSLLDFLESQVLKRPIQGLSDSNTQSGDRPFTAKRESSTLKSIIGTKTFTDSTQRLNFSELRVCEKLASLEREVEAITEQHSCREESPQKGSQRISAEPNQDDIEINCTKSTILKPYEKPLAAQSPKNKKNPDPIDEIKINDELLEDCHPPGRHQIKSSLD